MVDSFLFQKFLIGRLDDTIFNYTGVHLFLLKYFSGPRGGYDREVRLSRKILFQQVFASEKYVHYDDHCNGAAKQY